MKTAIYYFTGTGNTLVVAKDLAAELGGADLLPIVKELKEPHSGYDVVGIVYPVYMMGLPLIVAQFLRQFTVSKDAYIFCVANYGGLQGRANALVAQILRSRGLDLAAGYGVMMPGNYTPLYGAIDVDKQKAMFDEEKARVKDIARDVHERKRGILENKNGLIGFIFYLLFYRVGSMMTPSEDKKYWLTDTCTSCGLCVKVCPVDNIVMQEGRPSWLHHCQACMACLQWCPVEAIQYEKSTQGRKRYHYPSCTWKEIAAQKG